MAYVLGVDLGTTFSAAAIAAENGTTVVTLGTRTAAIPSIIFLREDGVLLFGEAAERRGVAQPERVAREFKRRFGDETPLLLAGSPYSADALSAHLLRHIAEQVALEQGGPPAAVVITHPATYGPYKRELLEEAVRLAALEDATLLTEPEAAAIHYATSERVSAGDLIAVYDLGGGTFDAAVVRRNDDGFVLVGTPEGIERFGGIDIDHAIFGHVATTIGDAISALDRRDPSTRVALAQLREACRQAKETLSTDTEAIVPVMLPSKHTEVRLTRLEFETMITPRLVETVAVLQRSIRSAGVSDKDVSRVLLVGGCSRIPLVADLVRDLIGRPVALDANPKHAIALGAAAYVKAHTAHEDAAAVAVLTPIVAIAETRSAVAPAVMPAVTSAEVAPIVPAVEAPPVRSTGRARSLLRRAAVLVPIGAALAFGGVVAAAQLVTSFSSPAPTSSPTSVPTSAAAAVVKTQAGLAAATTRPTATPLGTVTLQPQSSPTASPAPKASGAPATLSPSPRTPTPIPATAAPIETTQPTCDAGGSTASTGFEGQVLWGTASVGGIRFDAKSGSTVLATTTSQVAGVYRITGLPPNSAIVLDVPAQSSYTSNSYYLTTCGGSVAHQDLQILKPLTINGSSPMSASPGPLTVSWSALSGSELYCVGMATRNSTLNTTDCTPRIRGTGVTTTSITTMPLNAGTEYTLSVYAVANGIPVGYGFVLIEVR